MLLKPFIRLLAFFGKEVNEVRRQPRLVLSLMLGPLLVLMLFGVGYKGETPTLRTALVVPPERLDDPSFLELRKNIEGGSTFQVVSYDSNRQAAQDMLARGEIDLVEVLPPDFEERVLRGERTPVEFQYNEINPLNEQWIQYLTYVQVTELNKVVLIDSAEKMQAEAAETKQVLSQVRGQLDTLNSGLSSAKRDETRQSLQRLRDVTALLALSPLLGAQPVDGTNPTQTREQITQLRQDIDVLDKALVDGTIDEQRERIVETRDRVAALEQTTEKLSTIDPNVLVTPLEQQSVNIRGEAQPLQTYYAPGVLALILQHIAVTLGALSLVKERLLGALELFAVAPVSMLQVLIGKYLGYTLFIGGIAILLALALIFGLGVPFAGSVLAFAGLLLLFVLASLGVGFLISVASTSDSQAVQLSMLTLLLSIFFSGFFLPLENFSEPVQAVGYALPLTHAIDGFQRIMFEGGWPSNFSWSVLGAIAGIAFVLVAVIWGRQFRRVAQ